MFIRRTSRIGFTLMEILLVIAILAVLAGIAGSSFIVQRREAMIDTTRIEIDGFESVLRLYAAEHDGEYPDGSREEVVRLLMNPGNGSDGRPMSPYLTQAPTDAWNQLLFCEYPNTRAADTGTPAIWSSGPNERNENGSGDDINNWDTTVR